LNPVWEQQFEFSVTDPSRQKLTLLVRDKDLVGKDDALGDIAIPISEIQREGKMLGKIYDLQNTKTGKIQLSLTYKSV